MSDMTISGLKRSVDRAMLTDMKKKAVIVIGELIIRSYMVSKIAGKKIAKCSKKVGKALAAAGVFTLNLLIDCADVAAGFFKSEKVAYAAGIVRDDAIEMFKELGLMVVDNRRRIARAVFATAFAIMVGTTSILGVVFGLGYFNKYSFSKDNWNKFSSDRADMIDSLEEQYTIIGMSNTDIEDLLGTPELSTAKSDCQYKNLKECDFDDVVEYTLNGGSKSIIDVVEKHYAVAYKDGKAVWSDVVMADIICDSDPVVEEDIQTAQAK